ncbi:Hypothetical protein SRAE_1000002400 [Strongyloides ratti]|uniref:Uncharacterized protein n=1 Tax=Strongyloides ratti TaxID=34506 RepID=A0A090L0X6_STRRB|nr:Hypothetical protein SRAE_1000002400 [Strongyloides ratti]CEF61747.1 Hypothetical protein SRAE_1000002400 [Strongyloides ratti]
MSKKLTKKLTKKKSKRPMIPPPIITITEAVSIQDNMSVSNISTSEAKKNNKKEKKLLNPGINYAFWSFLFTLYFKNI